MAFPLLGLELGRMGRRPWAYRARLVAPVLASLLLFFFRGRSFATSQDLVEVGVVIHKVLYYVQWGLALLVPMLATAEGIAADRDSGALELVLVSGARAADIFLAKWTAALVSVLVLLLGVLPMLAFVSFMGGIEVGTALAQLALFVVLSGMLCSVGLCLATLSGSSRDTLMLTAIFALGYLAATQYVDRALPAGSRPIGLYAAIELMATPAHPPLAWLPSAGLAGGVAGIAVLAGARQTSRILYARPSRTRTRFVRGLYRRLPVELAAFVIERNADPAGSWVLAAIRTPFTLVALPLLAYWYSWAWFLIVTLMLYSVIGLVRAARASRVIEDLMATPLTVFELSVALWQAGLIRALVFLPAWFAWGMTHWYFALPKDSLASFFVGGSEVSSVGQVILGVPLFFLCATTAIFMVRFAVSVGSVLAMRYQSLLTQIGFAVVTVTLAHLMVAMVSAVIAYSASLVFGWFVLALAIAPSLGVLATILLLGGAPAVVYAALDRGLRRHFENEFLLLVRDDRLNRSGPFRVR